LPLRIARKLEDGVVVGLLVCEGCDFLDWMKETHPNILVIYILSNYTSVLQPIDVILQWLLKHAFKVQFYSWTTAVIKQQIEDG
jgi:hypothetical protein